MIILFRVKPTIKNGKKIYTVQHSMIPFLWSTISTYTNKKEAEKEKDILSSMASRFL